MEQPGIMAKKMRKSNRNDQNSTTHRGGNI